MIGGAEYPSKVWILVGDPPGPRAGVQRRKLIVNIDEHGSLGDVPVIAAVGVFHYLVCSTDIVHAIVSTSLWI